MDSTTQELIGTLNQLAELLESDGDRHWSSWIRRARARLERSDYSGADYLLSAYGGMGSFNDLILGQSYSNGQFAWKNCHIELNERLDKLRSMAWELAQQVKRQRGARA